MERGKERAELRSQGLRRLLLELENKRDVLLDELAEKKGQVTTAEASIKRIHEMILDINKEEKEAEALEEKLKNQRAENAKQKKENAPRKEKFTENSKGEKNSTKKNATVERARKARGRKLSSKKED